MRSSIKETIHYILLNKGIATGTQVFFGVGQDYDYVITESELGNRIMSLINVAVSEDYPDSNFHSYKFIYDGKEINAIIVPDIKWKIRWSNATNQVNSFLINNPESKPALRANKQLRIALFAWFLYDKERLNAGNN